MYEECLQLIKLECQSEGISETLLNLGSCYSGQKAGSHANFENKVERCLKYFEKSENKQKSKSSAPSPATSRPKSGNNSNQKGKGKQSNNSDHQAEYVKKISSICAVYNNGGCEDHPCPRGLKHICSEIINKETLRMCFKRHPKTEH